MSSCPSPAERSPDYPRNQWFNVSVLCQPVMVLDPADWCSLAASLAAACIAAKGEDEPWLHVSDAMRPVMVLPPFAWRRIASAVAGSMKTVGLLPKVKKSDLEVSLCPPETRRRRSAGPDV